MRKISLYIASSIDGNIARGDGSVDWLDEFPNSEKPDMGYFDFIADVDTLLFGANTYRQVLTFGDWPYHGMEAFVFSRNPAFAPGKHATLVTGDVVQFVSELKNKKGKTIWLVGGGEVNSLLLNEDLIDEIILTVVPIVLGEGIPLFAKCKLEKHLRLEKTETFANGMVQLTYARQKLN